MLCYCISNFTAKEHQQRTHRPPSSVIIIIIIITTSLSPCHISTASLFLNPHLLTQLGTTCSSHSGMDPDQKSNDPRKGFSSPTHTHCRIKHQSTRTHPDNNTFAVPFHQFQNHLLPPPFTLFKKKNAEEVTWYASCLLPIHPSFQPQPSQPRSGTLTHHTLSCLKT